MASVAEHYDKVLSDVYSWMLGGFDVALQRNRSFFSSRQIQPPSLQTRAIAVDLGAGCGFQSIPLAELGFEVLAVDLDKKLLNELESHKGKLPIQTVIDDLLNFKAHVEQPADLIICMTDTLLHLPNKAAVKSVFAQIKATLSENGQCIFTFRDLTHSLTNLDRFIPLRSDDERIFTCFVEEGDDEHVRIHDLVHIKTDTGWQLNKSYYHKLRLSPEWVEASLKQVGFTQVSVETDNGTIVVIAKH